MSSGIRLTQDQFIQKSIEKHGTYYSYDKAIYVNKTTPVIITCPIHGDFKQSPFKHYNEGNGCVECAKMRISNKSKMTNEQRRELTRSKFFDFIKTSSYDYSKVKYVNATTNVEIICKSHGSFWQQPHKHLSGNKCPKCSNSKIHTREEVIQKASLVHNHKYTYDKIEYTGLSHKVIITCPTHGDFLQDLRNHIYNKKGCPKCKFSHGERTILKILIDNKIKFVSNKRIGGYGFPDFILPDYNLFIEHDGEQHYKGIMFNGSRSTLEQIKLKDDNKNEFCLKQGIKLVRIPYWVNVTEEKLLQILKTTQGVINVL